MAKIDGDSARLTRVANFLVSSLSFYGSALFSLLLLAIITADVLMRQVFKRPIMGAQEFTTYFMAATSMLGLSYTLKMKGHIRIDLLVNLLRGKPKEFVGLVHLVLTVLCTFALDYVVFSMLIRYFVQHTKSMSILRVPLWLTLLPLAIGTALFTLCALIQLVDQARSCAVALKREKSKTAHERVPTTLETPGAG